VSTYACGVLFEYLLIDHQGLGTRSRLSLDDQHTIVIRAVCDEDSLNDMIDVLRDLPSTGVQDVGISNQGDFLDRVEVLLSAMDVSEIWKIQDQLHLQMLSHTVNTIVYRGLLLLVNMAAWQWLRTTMDEEYKRFTASPRVEGWLTGLYQGISRYIDDPKRDTTLKASECIDEYTGEEMVYIVKASSRRVYFPRTQEGFRDLVEPVLLDWLGFPRCQETTPWRLLFRL
jgi:hypothetical protein